MRNCCFFTAVQTCTFALRRVYLFARFMAVKAQVGRFFLTEPDFMLVVKLTHINMWLKTALICKVTAEHSQKWKSTAIINTVNLLIRDDREGRRLSVTKGRHSIVPVGNQELSMMLLQVVGVSVLNTPTYTEVT